MQTIIYAFRDNDGVVIDQGTFEECEIVKAYFKQSEDVGLWTITPLYTPRVANSGWEAKVRQQQQADGA